MSNLNSDQVDDIPAADIEDPNDLIKSPSELNPNQVPVEITAKNDNVANDVTELTSPEMQELVNMDMSFKIVKDNVEKILRFKDIEADLVATESISFNRATLLNESLGGNLDASVSLMTYTQRPSKVNYQETLKYVNTVIAKEEDSFFTIWDQFIDAPITAAQATLSKVKNDILPYLKETMKVAADNARGALKHAAHSKNFVFPYKNDFVNIGQVDLLGLELDKEEAINSWDTYFVSLLINVNYIFKCKEFKSFFFTTIENKYVMEAFEEKNIFNYSQRPVTLVDIFKFLTSSSLEHNLDYFISDVTKALVDMDKLQKESQAFRDSFTNIENFITENSPVLFHLSRDMYQMCLAIHGTKHLVLNGKNLADVAMKV
jgi:hypothetical protein